MTALRAVLFDFGGTLYDYGSLARAEARSLAQLIEWAGIDAPPEEVRLAQRESARKVFTEYLSRPFYLHRDLFNDTLRELLASFGKDAEAGWLDRYRAAQWAGHARDLELRPGVTETLSTLRARGLHVGMVSNIDEDQLKHLLEISGVRPYFDAILSSERAGSCNRTARSSSGPCAAPAARRTRHCSSATRARPTWPGRTRPGCAPSSSGTARTGRRPRATPSQPT